MAPFETTASNREKPFPDLTLRTATPADYPMLAQMNLELIQDEGHRSNLGLPELEKRFEHFQSKEDWIVEVVELSDEPVGFVTYRFEKDDTLSAGKRAYLRQFFIARKSRRSGLGRAAIELLLDERFKEPMIVRLEVLDSNPKGFGFWTAVGFQGYSRNLERTSAASS
ncbi:GNAT family N-acetyltransferase [Rhizobium rhizogenes]|uniref:GNAT family N-acetyltransferase n=1 Tax=Rhizobium rhizogenes TaxID=359 RepID=UPI001573547A|nr:GNAT family N-acetyltransferase [Rhizobium rhizogenes]NTH68486.1 GNAT family N-acetyltransferase [Rhizobium rhizogenes]NTI39114.1 GNAT family N-acetyltransferase [Rhizobium rhizogenes]WEO70153.1 GNAT family N-acetyltransferase [Rhizobium rhizogenes]